MYVDIWDGEWDEFRNKVIELATFWVRLMYDNQQAFMIERYIEEIRQNARLDPPEPWTAKTTHKFKNMPIPFLRKLQKPSDKPFHYFLTHPCIILMNIIHRFQSVQCQCMQNKIEELLFNYHAEINKYDKTMAIEYRRKNEITNRYTEIGFTDYFDNTRERRKRLSKRFKEYSRVNESVVKFATQYVKTYDMDITREEPVIPPALPLPPPRRIDFEPGVYGPTVQEQKNNFNVPVQGLGYRQRLSNINLY